MSTTWIGRSDRASEAVDESKVVEETLELSVDGTFKHALECIVDQSGDAHSKELHGSCHGRWQLHNVRHLGADIAAQGDHEISFERAADSQPLHAEKLVVCGNNPCLNGFFGASCRLYPSTGAHSPDAEEPEQALDVHACEALASWLSEIGGWPVDECLAVLLDCDGDEDEAMKRLGENGTAGPEATAAAETPEAADLPEEQATESETAQIGMLQEATSCTATEALAALRAHGGRADDAAAYLLAVQAAEADDVEAQPSPAKRARTSEEDEC